MEEGLSKSVKKLARGFDSSKKPSTDSFYGKNSKAKPATRSTTAAAAQIQTRTMTEKAAKDGRDKKRRMNIDITSPPPKRPAPKYTK